MAGYINTIISKKSLRDIISHVIKVCGVAEAAEFLDGIKTVAYTHLGKRLFSRVIKTRSSKLADKALLPKIDDEFDSKVADLKKILVIKLLKLTENHTSEGVKDYMGAEVILSLIHI